MEGRLREGDEGALQRGAARRGWREGGKEGGRNGGRNGERPDRRVCASAGDVGDSESPQRACAAWGSAMDQALKGLSAKKERGRERSSGASKGGGSSARATRAGAARASCMRHAVRCGKRACGQRGAGTSIQKLCEGVEKLLTGERIPGGIGGRDSEGWTEGGITCNTASINSAQKCCIIYDPYSQDDLKKA